MNERKLRQLTELSKEARRLLAKMIGQIGVGHVGRSLSLIEALVYLCYEEMHVRPEEPGWLDRDRIVSSKGHAGPTLYTLLAMKGYFNKETLLTLNQSGTRLPSHCNMKLTTGIDMTVGLLGQGLSAATGMMLAAHMECKDYRVCCIVGDDEQQEGQIWEAAMYAGGQELDNLVVLVDDNRMQIDDYIDAVNAAHPLDKRWEAFGWATLCIDGRNFLNLEAALTYAHIIKKRPTVIIMATVKGKGLSVAEGKLSSHNMLLSPEDVAVALQELQQGTRNVVTLESQEMRKVYCDTMIVLAGEDPCIVDVEADLTGVHGMKPFKAVYPDRSFSVGTVEANMIGVAVGLSACGKIPFVHSFATFASRRCFDQIAILVCYAGLNVKIVGSDPGVGAELNGGTHMALEDMGIMRTLPGMTVFEPTDSVQFRKALPTIVEREDSVYIRLFRCQAENVFDDGYKFDLGRADLLRDGPDVTLTASGVCVANALQAAETLAQEGISTYVLNIHIIKPIDANAVIKAASETGALVMAENHNVTGGLSSAVAEVLAEQRPTPLERVDAKDYLGQVGKTSYLMGVFGITAADIVKAARKAIARK